MYIAKKCKKWYIYAINIRCLTNIKKLLFTPDGCLMKALKSNDSGLSCKVLNRYKELCQEVSVQTIPV